MAGYNNDNNWIADESFTLPVGMSNCKSVVLKNVDWQNVIITFDILNFRHEKIYTANLEAYDIMSVNINEELAALLKYGSYQFVFTLNGINEYASIYLQDIYNISIVQKRISNTDTEPISMESGEEGTVDIHLILDGGIEGIDWF